MSKKGFTLIELLAVLVILVIIMAIATPIILGIIDDSRKSATERTIDFVIDGAEKFYATDILDNVNSNKFNGSTNIYEELVMSGDKPEYGVVYIDNSGNSAIAIFEGGKCYVKDFNDKEVYIDEEALDKDSCFPPKPKASAPVVSESLFAVTIDALGNVKKADASKKDWYDYENKQWANAVIIDTEANRNYYETAEVGTAINKDHIRGYFVWIPRYEYQLFDLDLSTDTGEEHSINIVFVDKDEPKKSEIKLGEYYTHPAFTIDNGATQIELDGIWAAKFEYSAINQDKGYVPTIHGAYTTVSGDQIKYHYTYNKEVASLFGLSDDTKSTDTHMMKNSEWGAILYLSQSTYGINSKIWRNASYSDRIGCGANDEAGTSTSYDCVNAYGTVASNVYMQTTTGNISGIFGMADRWPEYTMGNFQHILARNDRFTFPSIEYYDYYDTNNINTQIGHALGETIGWNGSAYGFPNASNPWFRRGQWNAFEVYGSSGQHGYGGTDTHSRGTLWIY